MNLLLLRKASTENACEGELWVRECHTLEDPVRETKIPGKTAIPAGRYQVVLDHSPRFKKILPRLLNVPGFEGVRIHTGNKPEDTEGCILVGDDPTKLDDEWIGLSRPAFNRLMLKMKAAQALGNDIWITIRNADD